MKKILIVDDHPLVRKGLTGTLKAEPDLTVCSQVADAEEALSALEECNPDLAIVDISLPGMSGLERIKHMQALRPEMYTLVVSRHDEVRYAERAIRAGARGYIMKREAADMIVKAVRRVLADGIYVSEEINVAPRGAPELTPSCPSPCTRAGCISGAGSGYYLATTGMLILQHAGDNPIR